MSANGIVAVFGSVGILVVSCAVFCPDNRNEPKENSEFRVEGIERILMHTANHFTVFAKEKGSEELKMVEILCFEGDIRWHKDVPENSPSWLMVVRANPRYEHKPVINAKKIEFHIHSAKQINGAGWDNGKFGSGQTTVVE